jgi:hypothetical protein
MTLAELSLFVWAASVLGLLIFWLVDRARSRRHWIPLSKQRREMMIDDEQRDQF